MGNNESRFSRVSGQRMLLYSTGSITDSVQNYYPRGRNFNVHRIHCSSKVEPHHIAVFILDTKLSEGDRYMLKVAKTIVAKEADFIFRNVEIRIPGEKIDVTFHAGRPTNIYVINRDENSVVETICKAKCLRHQALDEGYSIWSMVTEGDETATSGAMEYFGSSMDAITVLQPHNL